LPQTVQEVSDAAFLMSCTSEARTQREHVIENQNNQDDYQNDGEYAGYANLSS